MVNYALLNSDNIVENILFFEFETEDLTPFIEAQNLVCDNRIVSSVKITQDHKHWGIGMKYENGKFISKKPYNSWLWDNLLEDWIPPVPHPTELNAENNLPYFWNEESQAWEIIQ